MAPIAKRRKIETKAVEEVTFDPSAREEYLSGFHKRKLERAKHARELAEKKARAERIIERRKLREERKLELERHVQEVNALLKQTVDAGSESSGEGSDADTDAEWTGIEMESQPPPPVDHEAEYVDEDRYTTVTIEEMDVSKEGIHKAEQAVLEDRDSAEVDKGPSDDLATVVDRDKRLGKRTWTKDRPKTGQARPKEKKKKFRYESKAERKVTRVKEKSKNSRLAKARRGE